MATRERRLWGEARSLSLQGLPVDDAVLLLEREIERPLEVMERSEAASLCASVGGHPLRLLQCAAIVRERGISLDAWASNIGPESLVTESLASIDEKQRRALLALAALPGVPLQVQHLSGIAELHGHRAIVDGARPTRSRSQHPVTASTRGRRRVISSGEPKT